MGNIVFEILLSRRFRRRWLVLIVNMNYAHKYLGNEGILIVSGQVC